MEHIDNIYRECIGNVDTPTAPSQGGAGNPVPRTSPVEDISTPSRGSEFLRRPKENMGTLQAWVMDGRDGMDGIIGRSHRFPINPKNAG